MAEELWRGAWVGINSCTSLASSFLPTAYWWCSAVLGDELGGSTHSLTQIESQVRTHVFASKKVDHRTQATLSAAEHRPRRQRVWAVPLCKALASTTLGDVVVVRWFLARSRAKLCYRCRGPSALCFGSGRDDANSVNIHVGHAPTMKCCAIFCDGNAATETSLWLARSVAVAAALTSLGSVAEVLVPALPSQC